MAPRKNAKGGGGFSTASSSSSSSGGGGGGSSSSGGTSTSTSSGTGSYSSGSRRDPKHGGHRNGRKGGLSGSSFFTWFMVIALLGVWTSVAVVWFELVDYEEVLGKLGVYDADGDGDFDVDDAKVLLGFKEGSAKEAFASERRAPPEDVELPDELEELGHLRAEPQYIEDEVDEPIQSVLHEMVHTEHGEDLPPEEAGPSEEPLPDDDSFLVASDQEDRFETPEHEMVSEDSREQKEDPEGQHYDQDDVIYQDYDDQVYEHSDHERIGISDDVMEDPNVFAEDVYAPPAEEQQEVPPDA